MKNLYFETLNKLRLNNINNAELDLRIIINNSLIKKKESLIQDIKEQAEPPPKKYEMHGDLDEIIEEMELDSSD